jgi:O-antigen biosynthesis protein
MSIATSTAQALVIPAAPEERARANGSPPVPALVRPHVRGKFLFAGDDKLYVRGVIYGAFRPDAEGREYQDLDVIDRDFARMRANGINVVRIPHITPPRSLLDAAQRHGLRVMVGLSAELYLGYLVDRKKTMAEIERLVGAKTHQCADHPAIFCYALGNEIPSAMARWVGRRTIERYLERLSRAVKDEDPRALVTYVNYPTTEYLRLPFLDLVSFNVYLESPSAFEVYLARLQNIAGERPLIMSELGLDGLRHGETVQAQSLDWQVRKAFAAGCAGVFVFSWTDEWYRASHDVEEWAFGLTHVDRSAKPALHAVQEAFAAAPFSPGVTWPRISVVVCSYNGARTLHDCLGALARVAYSSYEVIVVDDGSTDSTAEIARQYACRLIRTENCGLASARNTGLEAATGEIVAYIDDDAYPDPHWLTYLAVTFMTTTHAGVGGPNLPPAGDGSIADCVANAPGGPVHVLVSDREAEHIPGCNMAFRAACLRAIDGFDPQFRIAGDDVDVCWRLRDRGWTLGFSPAAVVWHHRRNSIRAYWRQQRHYGRAEALLARKSPEKYNGVGHVSWAGRLYGKRPGVLVGMGSRIYHGVWGSAPYQSLYQRAPGTLSMAVAMPEWVLVIAALGGLSLLGALWRPLLLALPLLVLSVLAYVIQAVQGAARATFPSSPALLRTRVRLRLLTALLHVMQPLARLHGRLQNGLAPWRRPGAPTIPPPWRWRTTIWSRHWEDPDRRLQSMEVHLRALGAAVRRGGDYDRWDLEVTGGVFAAARVLMAVEDHGAGHQLVRLRWWPRLPRAVVILTALLAALAGGAAFAGASAVGAILGTLALLLVVRMVVDCRGAVAAIVRALRLDNTRAV